MSVFLITPTAQSRSDNNAATISPELERRIINAVPDEKTASCSQVVQVAL